MTTTNELNKLHAFFSCSRHKTRHRRINNWERSEAEWDNNNKVEMPTDLGQCSGWSSWHSTLQSSASIF